MVDCRAWRPIRLVLSILFLGFLALESELIDCPRHWELDALRAEVQGLKQNMSKLQQVQLVQQVPLFSSTKIEAQPGESQAVLILAAQSEAPQVQTTQVETTQVPTTEVETTQVQTSQVQTTQTPQPRAAKPLKCEQIKSLLTATNREAARVRCRIFQFIHVPKNGGTSLEKWMEANDLRCLFSSTAFAHVDMKRHFQKRERGTCYVTFVRDPIQRWISGFLSRWRRSCPSHCQDWSPAEAVGFKKFPTPNKLAEAFSDPDPTVQQAADKMHDICGHLARGFAFFFPYEHKVMLPHVIFVGHTCNLEADVIGMLRAMGVPEERIASLLPAEYKYLQEELSPLALRNIQEKVKDDYKVLRSMAKAHLIDSENISSNCARLQTI
eukprot:Skav209016  [mRNA]  locus=scaffold2629:27550:28695:+ [translate_table: standard]